MIAKSSVPHPCEPSSYLIASGVLYTILNFWGVFSMLKINHHRLKLPLDYNAPSAEIEVYAKELYYSENKSADMLIYLQHFRADNIVKDCEAFRAYLIGRKKCYLLGQSYGGFTALTYLSFYPDALKGVFITGGLPPLPSYSVTEIYQRLLQNTVKVNETFYRQIIHTQLYNKIIQVFDILKQQPYLLPDGAINMTAPFEYWIFIWW